jgi:hypothetical protein
LQGGERHRGVPGAERGFGVDGERDREDDGIFQRRAVRTVVREVTRAFESATLVADVKMGDPVLPFVLNDPLDGSRRRRGEGASSEAGFDAMLQNVGGYAGLRSFATNPDETHGLRGGLGVRRRRDDDAHDREDPSRDTKSTIMHGKGRERLQPPLTIPSCFSRIADERTIP